MPSSRSPRAATEETTPSMVISSGGDSVCITRNAERARGSQPVEARPEMRADQETESRCGISSNTWSARRARPKEQ